jgi:hypothetical protein
MLREIQQEMFDNIMYFKVPTLIVMNLYISFQ